MIESPTRPLPSARRLRARLGVAVGIAALLVGVGVAPASGETTPSPIPTPTAEPGEAVFTLSPISGGVMQPGEGLTVSVTMTNDRFTPTSAGTVSLAFGGTALGDRSKLTAWLAGDLTAIVSDVAADAFPSVEAGEDETRGLHVDAAEAPLAGLAPGVYPVVATLTTADETFTSTSAVVVPDETRDEAGVGVVVPVTARATAQGLLTADELVELTGPEGSLTNVLDAVDGTDAILAVDPAIVAAIRVLGTSAPETAAQWLARLDALPNTRFALQFGDADVATEVQAGIVPPMRATSLQAYMTADDFTPGEVQTPAPSASPTVDPTAPVYPGTDELLDVSADRPGVFWPATGSAGSDVVAVLGGLTVDEEPGLTVIPSSTTVAGAGGATVAAAGTAGDAAVLVYDSAISQELEEASVLDAAPLRGAHLAAASAYLAFALGETGGGPLLVTVDRADDRSRVALRTAITTALDTPSADPVTLDDLTDAATRSLDVVDIAPDAERVAAASAFVDGEDEITQFASILDDPGLLTQPERAEILQLLGNAWRPQPVEWNAAVVQHRAETATTLDSVGILRASPIQLITSGAVIPVWVRNDLPYPANVTLFATPDDLRLRVQPATSVVAQPQSNTRVEVPLQAQLGSGDVLISFELRSPTGVPIGDPQTREVHVRAEWEAIGLVVIGVFGVGFLLLGVVRTVLRRRRRAADAEAVAKAEPGADAGPELPDAAATETPDAGASASAGPDAPTAADRDAVPPSREDDEPREPAR
ncbi:DUF6049 family protein [Microbacterium sp. NPDC019599]|uniref:DUF6049 family protein n=1 Tax=Microbacterium sp. NPDC019599 TaxID=3154690 RepID=UPI0033D2B1EC